MKDKTTAGILALLVGGIGVHKFYLNKTGQGILYLLFCWTLIPGLIAFFEGIQYLTMDQLAFDSRYNRHYLQAGPVHGYLTNQNPYGGQYPNQQYPNQQHPGNAYGSAPPVQRDANPSDDQIYERLEKLNELRVSGVISEEEFAREKQRLLQRL